MCSKLGHCGATTLMVLAGAASADVLPPNTSRRTTRLPKAAPASTYTGTLSISPFEFIQSGHGQAQTRHSHRMAERDRTAVGIQIVMRDFAQPLGPSISAELAFHKSRRVKNAHDPQHH